MSNTLFWNVDTQYDFMNDDPNAEYAGKLPVPGATEIKSELESLTDLAEQEGIQVVNTADWHHPSDDEISDDPDEVVEGGYGEDAADRVMRQSIFNDGLGILDEETVDALMEDEFETLYRNRLRQKAEYQPHLKEIHPHYFDEGDADG